MGYVCSKRKLCSTQKKTPICPRHTLWAKSCFTGPRDSSPILILIVTKWLLGPSSSSHFKRRYPRPRAFLGDLPCNTMLGTTEQKKDLPNFWWKMVIYHGRIRKKSPQKTNLVGGFSATHLKNMQPSIWIPFPPNIRGEKNPKICETVTGPYQHLPKGAVWF